MPHSRSPTGGRGLSSVLYLNTAMPQSSQQYANFVSMPSSFNAHHLVMPG